MTVLINKFITGPIETNTWIVHNEQKDCLIVDPSSGCSEVTGFISDNGLNPQAILLTHAHFDHFIGIPEIQRIFGDIPVYAHPQEKILLTNAGYNGSIMIGNAITYDKDTVDVTVGKMRIGSFDLEVLFVPGHSLGGVAYKFGESLLCGDILFAGSIGRSDFPGCDGELLIRGIKEKILTLDENTVVYPGHGGRTTVGREKRENPYLKL